MVLHKLWGLILGNYNIRKIWTAGVSFTCVKRLLAELHHTLYIKQTVIIFKLFIYDYAIKLRILDGFLKLNSYNHPTVTTLRPGAADGIRTVMQGFESRPTLAASGRLPVASGRCPDSPDGSGRRPGGSGRLLVGSLTPVAAAKMSWLQ